MKSRPTFSLPVLMTLLCCASGYSAEPSGGPEAEAKALPRLCLLTGHAGDVLSLAFLPESNTLISGSRDKTIRFWDAQTGKMKRTFAAHSGGVRSVACSSDSKTLASVGTDGLVKLWNPKTGAQQRVLEGTISTTTGDVTTIVWNPSGTLLAVSSSRRVVVWNAATGKQLRVLEIDAMRGPLGDYIAWRSNQQLATAGDEMSTVRFWDVETGERGQELKHHGHIHSMAIRPDRNVLVTGGHSPYLTFFDLAAGTKRIVKRGDPHLWLAWSPDGNALAAGPILLDATGNVRATVDAWDKKTSWPMWSSGPVAAWSSDSEQFATVREKDIEVWDTSSLIPARARSQEAKLSGDWEVTVAVNGKPRTAILSLLTDAKGNQSGQWIGREQLSQLEDIKYESGSLSFNGKGPTRDGQSTAWNFAGSIKEGQLSGTISSRDRGEHRVTGKRIPPLPDLVGNYGFNYAKVEGTFEATFALAVRVDKEGKFTAKWRTVEGEIPTTDLAYEDGVLTFKSKLGSYKGSLTQRKSLNGTYTTDADEEYSVLSNRLGTTMIGNWNLEVTSKRGTRNQRLKVYPDLSGWYGAVAIKEIRLKGDDPLSPNQPRRVTFQAVMKSGERTVEMSFVGEVTESKLSGEITTSGGTANVVGKKVDEVLRTGATP